MTANALPWLSLPHVDQEAFKNRCIIWNIRTCPGLRKYPKDIHPGAWAFQHHFYTDTDVEGSTHTISSSSGDSSSDSTDNHSDSPSSEESSVWTDEESNRTPVLGSPKPNCHCTKGHILSDLDTPQEVHFAGGWTFTEVPPPEYSHDGKPQPEQYAGWKTRYLAKRQLKFEESDDSEPEILPKHASLDEAVQDAPKSHADILNECKQGDFD